MRLLAALLLVAAVATGHICVWSPMQRQPFAINTPGARTCFRYLPPCGNITAGAPLTKLVAGSRYTVQLQQNLNRTQLSVSVDYCCSRILQTSIRRPLAGSMRRSPSLRTRLKPTSLCSSAIASRTTTVSCCLPSLVAHHASSCSDEHDRADQVTRLSLHARCSYFGIFAASRSLARFRMSSATTASCACATCPTVS